MDIVLIHTGGTIGMAPSDQGLVPVRGRVEAAVAEMLPKMRVLQPMSSIR